MLYNYRDTHSCNVSLQLHLSYLHVVYDILIIFLFYPCSLYHQTKGKNRSFDIYNQQVKQSELCECMQFKSKV